MEKQSSETTSMSLFIIISFFTNFRADFAFLKNFKISLDFFALFTVSILIAMALEDMRIGPTTIPNVIWQIRFWSLLRLIFFEI